MTRRINTASLRVIDVDEVLTGGREGGVAVGPQSDMASDMVEGAGELTGQEEADSLQQEIDEADAESYEQELADELYAYEARMDDRSESDDPYPPDDYEVKSGQDDGLYAASYDGDAHGASDGGDPAPGIEWIKLPSDLQNCWIAPFMDSERVSTMETDADGTDTYDDFAFNVVARSRRVARTRSTPGAIELARRDLERAQRAMYEAEKLAERNGVEPPVGAVVTYLRRYSAGPRHTYTFAAVRVESGWYVTGRETGVYTWEQINSFAIEGSLRVATGWTTDRAKAATVATATVVPAELPFTGARYTFRGREVIEYVYAMGEQIRREVVKTFPGKEKDAVKEARKLADHLQRRAQIGAPVLG